MKLKDNISIVWIRISRPLIVIGFVLFGVLSVLAQKVWTPQEMPDVQVADRREYVSDPSNAMDREATMKVNQRLAALRQQTTAEVAVAIAPNIGDIPIEEWSEQLFTLWGIGKSDRDNGVLLVIALDQHKARIQTGYGAEGVLPDIACANIISEAIVPNMRAGDLDAAVEDATAMIAGAMTDPAVAEELRSREPDNYSGVSETLSPEVFWSFIKIVAGVLLVMEIFCFCRDLWLNRKGDNHERALRWRNHLKSYFWCGILTLGPGLLIFLLALWRYRSLRTRRRVCPTCGAKMRRLGEEEDNELLSPSQDLEERLNTVDYDVWECPDCGTIERFPYRIDQKRYTECPNCHTVAMGLKSDRVLRPATTRSEGLGERVYECEFCHHQHKTGYRIPRKEDAAAAAIAAGAILGSGRHGGDSGFGGGGGFGGGFGGGSTGGGGASGGW